MPRPFPYNAARFRFAFRLHLLAIIGLALVAILILRASPRLMPVAYILLVAMVIVIALTLLNALWPVKTTHSVDGEAVILRQGLGFKLVIPLARISKAKRLESGAGRTGINLDRANGVLEVIAHGPDAVRLRLNDPVVYKGTLVREVVVDVLEPREFIDCIRDRKKGAALLERHDRATEAVRVPGPDAGPEEPGRAEEIEGPDGPEAPEGPEEPAEVRPEPLASTPPIKAPKAAPRSDDEDEIELVPALPASRDAGARVVRLPKRKI